MLHLGTKLYATLKLFPSSGVYKLFFHSTFQANMFLEVWGFFILPFSSGNGNELNDFLWTSVALDELHKDPKHSFELNSVITTIGFCYHDVLAFSIYPMYILENLKSQSIVSSV